MLMRVPTATIRTHVSVPLRFADGYVTEARVFSFHQFSVTTEQVTVSPWSLPLLRVSVSCESLMRNGVEDAPDSSL